MSVTKQVNKELTARAYYIGINRYADKENTLVEFKYTNDEQKLGTATSPLSEFIEAGLITEEKALEVENILRAMANHKNPYTEN